MKELEEKAYIFGTIFTLSNRLQSLGDRLDAKLTVKQWLFLAGMLRSGNSAPTLSQIALRTGSSRQNVKKMALILEKQGFVSLVKDARDGRALRVALTESCRAHLKEREETELRFIEEVFSDFEPEDLAALSQAMKRLEKNVGKIGRWVEAKED